MQTRDQIRIGAGSISHMRSIPLIAFPLAFAMLAFAKLRLGDKPGAIADFRKALELRPDLATTREALRKLGVTL
jgi:hypothetical protein